MTEVLSDRLTDCLVRVVMRVKDGYAAGCDDDDKCLLTLLIIIYLIVNTCRLTLLQVTSLFVVSKGEVQKTMQVEDSVG